MDAVPEGPTGRRRRERVAPEGLGEAGSVWRRVFEGLGEPAILLWDGGSMHKGDPVDDLVALWEGKLHLEPTPPNAPELMPPEQLWTWLK